MQNTGEAEFRNPVVKSSLPYQGPTLERDSDTLKEPDYRRVADTCDLAKRMAPEKRVIETLWLLNIILTLNSVIAESQYQFR